MRQQNRLSKMQRLPLCQEGKLPHPGCYGGSSQCHRRNPRQLHAQGFCGTGDQTVMSDSQRLLSTIVALFLPILSQEVRAAETAGPQELILAAYSVPKEAYEKRIIPAFQQQWKQRTGQEVRIRSSYGASGAQARAIIGGFQADIAALSLEGDLDQVAK